VDVNKEIALEACKVQQDIGLLDSKIPVLVGKTSSGKTYWIQHELADKLELPVVKILLQNEQADEVLGYPKFMGNDQLEFLKPAWWTDTPSIFFFDELDKSRDELHASILTLLREGTIRGRALPKGSVIICAMNESDYLSDPLKARCLFLPFEYGQRGIEDRTLTQVSDYLQSFVLPVELPTQAIVPENLHYLDKYQSIDPNILSNNNKLRSLCYGLFPPKNVLPIMGILSKLTDLDYVQLIKDDKLLDTFIKSISTVHDGHRHFIEFLKVWDDDQSTRQLDELVTKFSDSNAEDLVKFYELCHDAWLDDIPNIGNHVFNKTAVKSLGEHMRYILRDLSEDVDTKLQESSISWDEKDAK